MTEQPEVLVFGVDDSSLATVIESLRGSCKVTTTENLYDFLEVLRTPGPNVCLMGQNASNTGLLLEVGGLLQHFPEAVLLLNIDGEIQWGNHLAHNILNIPAEFDSLKLFDAWEAAEIIGPDYCPINSVIALKTQVQTTVRIDDKHFYELTVKPIGTGEPKLILATLRDTSEETIDQQKIDAIYKAGLELSDLNPEELLALSTDDRIELLKSKLLHHTQVLLEFETVEIRILDQQTKELKPLASIGMQASAEKRVLKALAEGNGVTGFVAATGKSYLCEDTSVDPLYLEGAANAKSSLTVPLMRHDQVLGTFNVESTIKAAFSPKDLKFLELFCREVAVALNTLELLMTEKASTKIESSNRVLCQVSMPIDDILNDAVWVYEKYNGQDPLMTERLKSILNQTQEVRRLILESGESSVDSKIKGLFPVEYPELKTKRILVVDPDEEVRRQAHAMLDSRGCIVMTSNDCEEALRLIRGFPFDLVISALRLPDCNGAVFLARIREIHEHLPFILTKGSDYDPEHILGEAIKIGLKTVIYSPLILRQLLKEIAKAVSPPQDGDNPSNGVD